MQRSEVATQSQQLAALASTAAPEAKNKRTFETGATESPQDPDVNDRITALNAANSPLLRLPAELRNMIYGNVFDYITYNLYMPYGDYPLCESSFQEAGMGLILVSRQVHDETAYLPYELSAFDFLVYDANKSQWKSDVRKFLAKRSEEQIKAMSCLTLRRYSHEEQAFAMGTGLYWVKRLKIK
ncbi:hypothetical protein J4E89_009078 [Alternaria sp. Ai002NY15]|nr:hypothetical protein J4E89_009078 [Alternaria sp. Ai002NY15]